MSGYTGGESVLGKVMKWMVIGLVAIVAFKVGLLFLGVAVRASMFVLFTLGPIVLVGWLVIKMLRYFTRDTQTVSY